MDESEAQAVNVTLCKTCGDYFDKQSSPLGDEGVCEDCWQGLEELEERTNE
jgi:hypothetical protein